MAYFRCGGGSGGGGYTYLKTEALAVSSKNVNITGLTSGKTYYIVISYAWTNTNYSAELTTIGGASNVTKVTSGSQKASSSVTAYDNYSVYTFKATSGTASVQFSSASSSFNAVFTVFESA